MMNRIKACLLALGVAFLGLAAPAFAQSKSAYISASVNVRAGPALDFPTVRVAPKGTSVIVHGCLAGWEWCDVSWRGYRGWVSGRYLDYPWERRRVSVMEYGPRLGLSIISFNFGGYWDNHYRRQPWYGQRHRYERVIVRQPPPPPPPHGGHIGKPAPPPVAAPHHNRNDRHDDRRDRRDDRRNDPRRRD